MTLIRHDRIIARRRLGRARISPPMPGRAASSLRFVAARARHGTPLAIVEAAGDERAVVFQQKKAGRAIQDDEDCGAFSLLFVDDAQELRPRLLIYFRCARSAPRDAERRQAAHDGHEAGDGAFATRSRHALSPPPPDARRITRPAPPPCRRRDHSSFRPAGPIFAAWGAF